MAAVPVADATVTPPAAPATAVGARPQRRRFLPASWAVATMIAFYPIWWLLGLGGFSWTIMAMPMAAWLVAQRKLQLPRGMALYLTFLCFVFASAVRIDAPDRMAGYLLRTSWYVAAGILWLYLSNTERRISSRSIVRILLALWLATIVGGWLGLLMPRTEITSPVASALPDKVADNELVRSMVYPGFAEVQNVLGVELPRPKAPFFYTNGWGSAMALLTPVAIGALSIPGIRPGRRVIMLGLAASAIPILMSLNRGTWALLVIGILYAVARRGRAGNGRGLAYIVGGLVVVATLVIATPLGSPIRNAVDLRSGDSDARRTILYEEAIDRTKESPFLGEGVPRPSEETAQSVGTHGQFWTVMFSHGFIAAGLYLAFFVVLVWRTRNPATPLGLWCHVALVVGLLQMFFYGQLPQQLFLLVTIAAVAYREIPVVNSERTLDA